MITAHEAAATRRAMLDAKNKCKRDHDHVNIALSALTMNKYFESLPLSDIAEILSTNDFIADLDGIYCGHEGQMRIAVTHLLIKGEYQPTADPCLPLNRTVYTLTLSWYRMPSGRFEVTTYLS